MPSKSLNINVILSYDMMGIAGSYQDNRIVINNSIMSSNKELLLKTFQSSISPLTECSVEKEEVKEK